MLYFSESNSPFMNKDQKHLLFEQLFEHATESIIVIDEGGLIRFLNPSTERFFGYTREELRDKSIEVLVPERFELLGK